MESNNPYSWQAISAKDQKSALVYKLQTILNPTDHLADFSADLTAKMTSTFVQADPRECKAAMADLEAAMLKHLPSSLLRHTRVARRLIIARVFKTIDRLVGTL